MNKEPDSVNVWKPVNCAYKHQIESSLLGCEWPAEIIKIDTGGYWGNPIHAEKRFHAVGVTLGNRDDMFDGLANPFFRLEHAPRLETEIGSP
jgi:hypothetical protein